MIKCSRCKSFRNPSGINCVSFSGNPNATLYFLGEMAGVNEAEASRIEPSHFIGKAGAILNELLVLAGLERKDIAIANSHRCWKVDNDKPTKAELDACFPHTHREISTIKPKLVIALGGTALYQATGKTGIEHYRGKVLWSDRLNCKVYPTYHPMAVGYDPSKQETLEEDFKKIQSMVGTDPTEIKNYEYAYINTIEGFKAILPILQEAEDIYLDLECTGLDPYKDKISIVQLGVGVEPVYIIDPCILDAIRDDLRDLLKTKNIIGQDFSFDAKFLAVKFQIYIQHWKFDPCLAEFMLSGMKNNDLTYLVGKYATESYGYDDEVKKLGGAHLVQDPKLLRQYASTDVGVLKPIRRKQYKALHKHDMLWAYENITMPCNKVLTEMSLLGVKYDLEQLWKIDKKYEKKANRALAKALVVDGIKETEEHFLKLFNPRSSDHIKYLLLDHYQLPVLTTTANRNPSVTKDEMKIYAEKYENPYCKIMEKYRSYQTLRNNFLSGVVPKLDGDIAHTNYSLHAAASGRSASKDPNLLNIPVDDDFRRMIVTRPGYRLLHFDLEQIEIRVASVIYDDENLRDICNTAGKDFHSMIGSKVSGIPYDEFYTAYKAGDKKITGLRRDAKTVTFGVLYQQTPEGLAYALGISVEEARSFIDEYFSGFPQLKDNIERLKRFVIKYGYVETYFKLRRSWKYHDEDNHNMLREAVNHCVDSKTLCLTKEGWKTYTKLTLNDYLLTFNINTNNLEWNKPSAVTIIPRYKGKLVEFKSRTFSAITTPKHRWVVQTRNRRSKKKVNQFTTTDKLSKYGEDKIYRCGDYSEKDNSNISDNMLSLLGWILTDGYFRKGYKGKKCYTVGLCQSDRANPKNVTEIDKLFTDLQINTYRRIAKKTECVYWEFYSDNARLIRNTIPNKMLTFDLIFSLSKRQALILLKSMLKGDGSKHGVDGYRFWCALKDQVELFQALCVVAGKATTARYVDMSKYTPTSPKLNNIPKSKGCWLVSVLVRDKVQVIKSQCKEYYTNNELVWCPTVRNSTFVAMRDNKVFITGNCIQGTAWQLMQLILIKVADFLKDKKSRLIKEDHDSLVIEEHESEFLAPQVKEIMENINKPFTGLNKVRLFTDMEVGNNLADLEKLKIN